MGAVLWNIFCITTNNYGIHELSCSSQQIDQVALQSNSNIIHKVSIVIYAVGIKSLNHIILPENLNNKIYLLIIIIFILDVKTIKTALQYIQEYWLS